MNRSEPATTEASSSVLERLPLLAAMPADVRALLMHTFERRNYAFGEELVVEGEDADAFYVIVSGQARVVKRRDDGEELAVNSLRPGDAFGELALLERAKRTTTVRASGAVEVLRLERTVFEALVKTHPEIRPPLEAQTALYRLRDFLNVYTAFGRLSRQVVAALAAHLEPVAFQAGETVIEEYAAPGPLYVVRDGRLRVHDSHGDLAYLRKGDFFGEASVHRRQPRSASVTAVSHAEVLTLPPAAFRELLEAHSELVELVERRVASYEYKRVARVPLDFAREILPADSGVPPTLPAGSAWAVARTEGAFAEEPVEEERGDFDDFDASHGRPIRRVPHVWQIDEMDCGAACLAMVCRHFGRDVALSHIRRAVPSTADGTSLQAIADGGEAIGLETRAVKASKSRLDRLPLPAICHWRGDHWVVLHAVGGRYVRLGDPARGPRRLPLDEFLRDWSGYTVLVRPTPALAGAPEDRQNVRWMWQFVARERRVLTGALLLALAAAGLQLLVPILAQIVVDDVVPDRDLGSLNVLVLALLGALVGMTAATVVQRYLLSRAAVRIDRGSLDFLTDRLLALPYGYFATRKTGDMERRLAGMGDVRKLVVQDGVQALTALAQVVTVVGLMFVYSAKLALVFLATAPLYAALMRFSARRLRPTYAELEHSLGEYHSRQVDAIKGIATVKATNSEGPLRRYMLREFDELGRRMFRADFTIMLYEGAVQLLGFLGFALFLWVGGREVVQGDLSIGELVAFNALVALAAAPIILLLTAWDDLQVANVLLHRLNDVVDQEPEQGADRGRLRQVTTLSGEVSLRSLAFTYPGPVPAPVLEGVSLDVQPGTTVALVGRSGSGKTTLARLLVGLLEPTDGLLLYDGIDVTTLEYPSLRRNVGFVLQESYLFDNTIARNISLTADEPDMDAVIWAARMANAHSFVERLPLRYDTKVGESGVHLSGGQRQRIAIARALYNRPPILVLDEATSALDAESERAIKENMDELLHDRTAFVIAHRLSTVRDADLIVVLDRGRIAEQGSHDELLARKGLYYYLASEQLDL